MQIQDVDFSVLGHKPQSRLAEAPEMLLRHVYRTESMRTEQMRQQQQPNPALVLLCPLRLIHAEGWVGDKTVSLMRHFYGLAYLEAAIDAACNLVAVLSDTNDLAIEHAFVFGAVTDPVLSEDESLLMNALAAYGRGDMATIEGFFRQFVPINECQIMFRNVKVLLNHMMQ
jgi:hypothetical protein